MVEAFLPALYFVTRLEQCKGKVNAVVRDNSCSSGTEDGVQLHPKDVSESSCGLATSN